MGSDCSACTKCQIGLSEKENELYRQSIEYQNGTTNNKYSQNIPEIIFLQIKIKKFLKRLKQNLGPKERFYNQNYVTYELSNDNLDIISEKNENNSNEIDINTKKEERHHQIRQSQEKFKTLSQKYSTLNNNESSENNKMYKVEKYPINEQANYTGNILNGKQQGYGIQEWKDGARYEGDWKEGKTCGYGIFYHPGGDIYKGYWKDDMANGQGIYISKYVKYEGEW